MNYIIAVLDTQKQKEIEIQVLAVENEDYAITSAFYYFNGRVASIENMKQETRVIKQWK